MTPATDDLIVRIGEAALDHAIPLTMLLGMFTLFGWVLFRAQKSAEFEASEFLRDERGKLSFGRLAAFVCLMTHTWAISVWVVRGKIEPMDMVLYCVTWSGSLLLLQALDSWRGVKLGVVPPGMEAAPPPQTPPT